MSCHCALNITAYAISLAFPIENSLTNHDVQFFSGDEIATA